MNRLRTFQATIAAAALKLTASQKLLIGSVLVIMVMMMLLVQLYSGKPDMVPLLPGKPMSEQTQAVAFLQSNGIKYEEGVGGLMVPAARRQMILAQLSQGGALEGDNRILFDSLIEKSSWTMSNQQNRQLEIIAVQNELAGIISHMSGIRSAQVILHLPDNRSLGKPSTAPSASVSVSPSSPLNQNAVDAIAHLVASSRGIAPENVSIIDSSTNHQHRVRDESGLAAGNHLELTTNIEHHARQKIASMLAYIPGVIVTVHAQVDATRRTTTSQRVYNEGDGSASLLRRETTSETKDQQSSEGSESGARSNVGQDISSHPIGGSSNEQTSTESEFESKLGGETTQIFDPRGIPTKINAVVNIPRSYFVTVWGTTQGTADAENATPPDQTQLQPIITSEITRILGEVEELIDTSGMPNAERGQVKVSMIPIAVGVPELDALQQGAASLPSGGGMAGMLDLQPMVKTLALGGLAVVALGLVVFTALRSVKSETLPTAAELVGVPPALQGDVDLVGEAEEADSVLQGIELSEDEMRQRKVIEQVNELIDEQPEDAARLMGHWIAGV